MPSASSPTPFLDDACLRSVVDWHKAVTESLLHAQRVQLEMLAAWPRAVGAVQGELRDQWVCRFGGGVPLDG